MTSITKDDVLDIISTERRRLAVQFLDQHDGPVRLTDMAEWVASQQEGCAITELDAAARKRAYIPLYQNHLPKLESNDVVTMPDGRSRMIARGPTFDTVVDALHAIDHVLEPQTSNLGRVRGFFGGVADV